MKLPRRLIGCPIRPDRWTALRFASLRWAALPVIDRRWTVPLSAMALAFGIFVGIAIGPAAEGSLGSQMQTLVSVVSPPAPTPPAGEGGPANSGGGSGENEGEAIPRLQPTPTPPSDDGPFDTPPRPDHAHATPTTPTTADHADDDDHDGRPIPTMTTRWTTRCPSRTLVKGAVVHVNEVADSYTVARDDGTLTAVHAQNLPPLGDVISVETRTLANGTRAENGDRDRTAKTEPLRPLRNGHLQRSAHWRLHRSPSLAARS